MKPPKLNRWGMEGFKVASADFTNHALLSSLAATVPADLLHRHGVEVNPFRHPAPPEQGHVPLLRNSTYPTPFRSICAISSDCAIGRALWATRP